jgi:outer membrane receptor protein involved in Fe transport
MVFHRFVAGAFGEFNSARQKSGRLSLVLQGAAIAGLALATHARAADSAAPAEELGIQEIVVTAAKREQSIDSVPLSISAISGAQLQAQGINDIRDLAREVPTFEVQSTNGEATVAYRLRRVGNLGNIPSFEPAVGLFVDGAFRSRSFFGSSDMLDMDRVEIINGPQSTLYGKNTTAGVVSLYSRAPSSTLAVATEATIGQYQANHDARLQSVKGNLSGPIADGWNAGFSAAYLGHDYFFQSNFPKGPAGPDQNALSRYAARAQLGHAGDNYDLRLIVEQFGQNGRTGSPTATTFPVGAPAANLHNFLIARGLAPACPSTDTRDYGNCLYSPVDTNLNAQDATLLWNYHLPSGLKLSSVTSWDNYLYKIMQNDAVQLGAPILGYFDRQAGHSLQQEVRLTSPGNQAFDWLAGVFYYHNDMLRGGANEPTFYAESLAPAAFWKPVLQQLVGVPVLIGTPGQTSYVDSTSTTDYIGTFAQTVWNVGDRFHLNTGARWQREEKDATIHQYQNDPTPTLINLLINAPIPSTDLSRSVSKVTWSVSPQVDLVPGTMAYATAAYGFKSGGFNTGFGRLPASQREFGDETVNHYEIGLKSKLWNNRLELHTAIFDTIYHDYQDAAFIGAQFTIGNAQKATNKGAELGLSAQLTDTLKANFDASYANFRYTTYTDGVCYPGRAPDGSVPGTCNLSGEHPVNAPPTKLALGLEYRTPVSFGHFFTGVDGDWTSRYNTSFSADPRLTQDPYTWLRARVGVDFGHTQVILWGDNLLDKRVGDLDALLNLFSKDPSTQTFMQPPRSYGLTVRAKF